MCITKATKGDVNKSGGWSKNGVCVYGWCWVGKGREGWGGGAERRSEVSVGGEVTVWHTLANACLQLLWLTRCVAASRREDWWVRYVVG